MLDGHGQVLEPRELLPARTVGNVVDVPVWLGINNRLLSRLIAAQGPEKVAHRRRQKLREKVAQHDRPLGRIRGTAGLIVVRTEPSCRATDLERSGRAVPGAVADRALVQSVEIAQSPRPPSSGSHSRGSDGGAVGETAGCAATLAVTVGLLTGRPTAGACGKPHGLCGIGSPPWSECWMTMTKLLITVTKLQAHLSHVVRIQSRKKQPRHFQLLRDLDLLDWAI